MRDQEARTVEELIALLQDYPGHRWVSLQGQGLDPVRLHEETGPDGTWLILR